MSYDFFRSKVNQSFESRTFAAFVCRRLNEVKGITGEKYRVEERPGRGSAICWPHEPLGPSWRVVRDL